MERFFRGFVRTKNKRCLDKFKNIEQLRSYAEVKELDEFAGILNGDTILQTF